MSRNASVEQVILSTSSDWVEWFELIKTGAIQAEIWDFVNPNTNEDDLRTCSEPDEPTVASVMEGARGYKDLDEYQREDLKDLKERYKRKYKEYREKKTALAALVKRIQETVDRKHHYLLKDQTTPNLMLIALKKRLSPTERVRKRDLLTAYKKLQKPPRNMDIEDWLIRWQVVFEQCKEVKLAEVSDNRPAVDFLTVLRNIDLLFAEAELRDVLQAEEKGEDGPDLLTLIDRFENRRRISPMETGKTQPAFATLQGKSSKENPSDNASETVATETKNDKNKANLKYKKGKDRKPPAPCLCGEDHFFSSCPYLIESIRTPSWKPNAQTLKKVEESLQNDTRTRSIVEAARRRVEGFKEGVENSTKRTSFAVVHAVGEAHSTFIPGYKLRKSFILDSATDTHVCNDRTRFTTYRKTKSNDYLIAGDTYVPIQGYGTVEVKARSPDDEKTVIIELKDVAHPPTFHTSLISLRLAMKHGVDWLARSGLLIDEKGPICKVFDMHNQWVVEYNPIEEVEEATRALATGALDTTDTDSNTSDNDSDLDLDLTYRDNNHQIEAFATSKPKKKVKKSYRQPSSTASKDTWHRRLGHVSMEAIGHIPEALIGAKITPESKEPKDKPPSLCEECHLANMQCQISRYPPQRATEPFERVFFDLIQMDTAFNGDNWAMHFLCDKARTHYGYTFPQKLDARPALKNFTAFVKRQYKVEIQIWHTDGEKTMEKHEFGLWIRSEGYVYEFTAPDTPSQNGPAERAGGVIMRKARAMRIEAKMPSNLWPEFFKTAIYITNRTPTRQLKWHHWKS